jgi:hypothetical protein
MRATKLVLAFLTASACRTPAPPNGALRCGPGDTCPKGYACLQGACWREGEGPASDMADLPDLAGADLTLPPDLTPPPRGNGDGCTMDVQCVSGNCTDDVCCDKPCKGQCEACSLTGSVGTCTTLTSGLPVGGRAACAGAGTPCGGTCTGQSATACTYPGNTVICGAACDGQCNGAGTCSSVAGGTCPNGLACGGSGCKTMCVNNQDCQPNFMCVAPNCARIPESDCLDGVDNNGDAKADCDDPTCTASVECVNAPSARISPGSSTGLTCSVASSMVVGGTAVPAGGSTMCCR